MLANLFVLATFYLEAIVTRKAYSWPLIALSFVFSLIGPSIAVADITGIVAGGAVAGAVVDNELNRLDQSMEKAKETGDYVTAAALARVKEAIKAWRDANLDVLDKGFTELNTSAQSLLNTADASIDDALRQTDVTMQTVERLTLIADNIMRNIPTGDRQSYVVDFFPRVIVPSTEGTIRLTVKGVNLDKADPVIRYQDMDIKGKIVGPLEVSFDLPRQLLLGDKTKLVQHDLALTFSTASRSWIGRLIGLRSNRERTLTVYVVPEQLGTFTVAGKYKVMKRMEKQYEAKLGTFKGRNTEIAKLAHPPSGWMWVNDVNRRPEFEVRQYGGEKGNCHKDIGWNESSEDGIQVTARVDEIRNIDSLFGTINRRDGYVSCGLKGPIYQLQKVVTSIDESGIVYADRATPLDLPDNCENLQITVSMFNHTSKIFSGAASEKYFEIEGSGCSLALNPRLPIL